MGINSGFNSDNTESFIRIDTNSSTNPDPASRPAGTQILLDGSDGSGFFAGDVEANDFISSRPTGSGDRGVTLYVNGLTGSDVVRTGIYISNLEDEDTTDVTPFSATYDAATGQLDLSIPWTDTALTTSDLITFAEGALTFSCASNGGGNLASPEPGDSNFGAAFRIQSVTNLSGSANVSINVGNAKGASGAAHTFVSALTDGTTVIRKTSTDLVTTNQMVTAGYSPTKPFASIARAAVEAARITMGLAGFDPEFYDRVTVQVATSDQTVTNSVPTGAAITPWEDGYVPSANELAEFNDAAGGVILPRGLSVIGEDLRKSIIRPTYVPGTGDITTARSAIFRVTGGSYFFNFTFKDSSATNTTHHMLDCFAFTNTTQLDAFYDKVATAFGITGTYAVANPGETEITAPQPAVPTTDTDGITGSSPYIFNCSIRSLYGLCGIFADGDQDSTGFKSMVVAQFTGVSLQKDLSVWQVYSGSSWGNFSGTYDQFIAQDPNNIRMNPDRVSAHVRAINNAIIQEVSVFAIGQGIHHWVQDGGELTVTNSNSNFGGCAALAQGYKAESSANDTGWTVNRIRVAADLTEGRSRVRNTVLGAADSSNASSITLQADLQVGFYDENNPLILESEGYTLREDTYIWVQNPLGLDYRAQLDASAFSSSNPDRIQIQAALQTENGDAPGSGADFPAITGLPVYIRRLRDARNLDERRYAIKANNTTGARNPIRDYILQTDETAASISGPIPAGNISTIDKTTALEETSGISSLVQLRQNDEDTTWQSGQYYRVGDVARNANKIWICTQANTDTTAPPSNLTKWSESYVHMLETYNREGYFANAQPVLILDWDTDGTVAGATSTTDPLGWNLATMFSASGAKYQAVQGQLETATDYRGLFQFLKGIGGTSWTDNEVNTVLLPKATADRDRNPASQLDSIGTPNGAANTWANWPIEWRRPSNIRLYGHAYEWTGYLNYTKAIPKYQQELSALNRFTYYFTNDSGGRCYVSGFNEEGFLVFPNGLRDLTTNEDILITDLGTEVPSPDVDLPIISFENVNISGDLNVGGDTSLEGDVTIGGSLTVEGPTVINDDLTVSGDISVDNIDVSGDISVDNINASGDAQIDGDLTVDGTFTVGAFNPSSIGDNCGTTIDINATFEFNCTPVPVDGTIDLGTISNPFGNIYTGDLHLTNDRGSWTMIEEEQYLSLRDNKTGKVFKILMEEVK